MQHHCTRCKDCLPATKAGQPAAAAAATCWGRSGACTCLQPNLVPPHEQVAELHQLKLSTLLLAVSLFDRFMASLAVQVSTSAASALLLLCDAACGGLCFVCLRLASVLQPCRASWPAELIATACLSVATKMESAALQIRPVWLQVSQLPPDGALRQAARLPGIPWPMVTAWPLLSALHSVCTSEAGWTTPTACAAAHCSRVCTPHAGGQGDLLHVLPVTA